MNKKKRFIYILLFIFILSTALIVPIKAYGIFSPTYRALLIGNGEYPDDNSLSGTYNDLYKMDNMLSHNYYGQDNTQFSSTSSQIDLTKDEMINSIQDTFSDAKPNDISLLYYTGHGGLDQYNNAYLVGVDGVGLSINELETELRKIPGTIVVVLDSCFSGDFINRISNFSSIQFKGESNLNENDTDQFNRSVIDSFAKPRTRFRSFSLGSKYKVITASAKDQMSVEIEYSDGWGWGGEFTRAFVTGNGYNGYFLADKNQDNKVTLDEIYTYTRNKVRNSNVQVWPMNDDFIIGSGFSEDAGNNYTYWDLVEDIGVDTIWQVEFNQKLDDASWKDSLYILNSDNNKIPTNIEKSKDEKFLYVIPEFDYDYGSEYTLVIDDNILSKSGKKLKNKICIPFTTE